MTFGKLMMNPTVSDNCLNTSIAHLSILSNAHGAWPMFWLVLRR
jgi:hypothetical protein